MGGSTFFAALAGANARSSNRNAAVAADWREYAKELESKVNGLDASVKRYSAENRDLKTALDSWRDAAVLATAKAMVRDDVIQELTNGKKMADIYGSSEAYLAEVDVKTPAAKSSYGIKD